MAQFPYLPLFTDAWVSDTKHLTRLERGTYHDLLVLMWRAPQARLPNDNAWLGKHLGMTESEVQNELRSLISEFCQTDGNWITQKRLTKEHNHVTQISKRNSDNAKSLWSKKKASSETDATSHQSGNAPKPKPILNLEEERKKEPSLRSGHAPEKQANRGTRLAVGWQPLEADMFFAGSILGRDGASREIPKFCDYWHARAGPGAVKRDWSATWRNWCRKAAENGNGFRENGSTDGRRSAIAVVDKIQARLRGEQDQDAPLGLPKR